MRIKTRCAASPPATSSRSFWASWVGASVLLLPAIGVIPYHSHTDPLWIALFVVVILTARALAFRLVEGSVLSLDSAYYVAAALCVGAVDAGRLVAIALTVDASARLYFTRRQGASGDELVDRARLRPLLRRDVAAACWCCAAGARREQRGARPRAIAVEISLRVVAIATALLVDATTRSRACACGCSAASWRAYLARARAARDRRRGVADADRRRAGAALRSGAAARVPAAVADLPADQPRVLSAVARAARSSRSACTISRS